MPNTDHTPTRTTAEARDQQHITPNQEVIDVETQRDASGVLIERAIIRDTSATAIISIDVDGDNEADIVIVDPSGDDEVFVMDEKLASAEKDAEKSDDDDVLPHTNHKDTHKKNI